MRKKDRQRIFDRVVRELGGPTNFGAILKRSPQSVCNWRDRGNFPAVLADAIRDELTVRGYEIPPPELFRQERTNEASTDVYATL